MRKTVEELKEQAKELRKTALTMIYKAQSGHPGGSLSAADIVTALYFGEMNVDPKNPGWPDRDRFILSKGHVCPIVYSALGTLGYFDKAYLDTLRKEGSILQGHPNMNKCPGIDISTGSLGQGLSVAVGMAKAAKDDGKTHRIYCMLGDGECQEGQIWEAAMFAAHYKLDNLCCIVDYNKIQAKGPVHEIMNIEPLSKKWESFGFDVIEADGHSMRSILDAFYEAENLHYFGRPVVIIAHTIKGKGVSFMENTSAWHTHAPNREQLAAALDELSGEVSHKWKK